MQAAVLANARSRVCFQLPHADAVVMAKGHPELGPEDFGALHRYEIYANLMSDGGAGRYVSGVTEPLETPTGNAKAMRRHSRERLAVRCPKSRPASQPC